MSRLIIRFWIYVLPLPATVGMYFAWSAWSGSRAFSLFVLLLPLFYGYVVPGIATNILHKWKFNGPWVVGHYYAHHGFLYTANMSPLLLISFWGTPPAALSWETTARILVCTGTLNGFVYWIHDILLVRHRMVEIYNRPAAEGRSPEAIVTHYAPLCFFLIGLTYAAAALIAFYIFIVQHRVTPESIVAVSLAGAALMVVIPSATYGLISRK